MRATARLSALVALVAAAACGSGGSDGPADAVVATGGPSLAELGAPTDGGLVDAGAPVIAEDGGAVGDDLGAPAPTTGTICVASNHPWGAFAVSGAEAFAGAGSACSGGHAPGGYALSAGAATVTPPSGTLVAGATLTFDVAYPPLRFFGYWRDNDLQSLVCQIQDHVNFSMTDDSQGAVDRAASYGVANFGLTAPSTGGPAPLGASVVRDDADAAAWGWCSQHPCPNGISDGWTAVRGEIEATAAQIHAQHPNAHLLINLADGNGDHVLDFQGIPNFAIPNGIDWIGLECYFSAAACKANLEVLRPKLPAGARVFVLTPGETDYGTEASLVTIAQDVYEWTKQEPLILGVIGFVWTKTQLCSGCATLGVKEMPTLLAKYRALGDLVSGRASVAPRPDAQCPPP